MPVITGQTPSSKPTTSWGVPTKPDLPKRLSSEQKDLERNWEEQESALYERLVLKKEDSEELLRKIGVWCSGCDSLGQNPFVNGLEAAGLYKIIACFGLSYPPQPINRVLLFPPPMQESQVPYDSAAEDQAERDALMAGYYLGAATKAYNMGLDALRLALMMTTFKETLDSYIEYARKEKAASTARLIRLFQGNLLKACAPIPLKRLNGRKSGVVFTLQQTKEIIAFFEATFVRHVKLITYTLLRSRDLLFVRCRKNLEEDYRVAPLSTAVPAERWEDYLAGETEKARKEREVELIGNVMTQEEIEAKKRELIEKERLMQEAAVLAARPFRRVNGVVALSVEPIDPLPAEDLSYPTPATLFTMPPPEPEGILDAEAMLAPPMINLGDASSVSHVNGPHTLSLPYADPHPATPSSKRASEVELKGGISHSKLSIDHATTASDHAAKPAAEHLGKPHHDMHQPHGHLPSTSQNSDHRLAANLRLSVGKELNHTATKNSKEPAAALPSSARRTSFTVPISQQASVSTDPLSLAISSQLYNGHNASRAGSRRTSAADILPLPPPQEVKPPSSIVDRPKSPSAIANVLALSARTAIGELQNQLINRMERQAGDIATRVGKLAADRLTVRAMEKEEAMSAIAASQSSKKEKEKGKKTPEKRVKSAEKRARAQ
ncbi:hypothetical protein HK101_002382 [Irineochytrium annulatum]|nr:hypothetical protein HK101_002382 [Irineochytrium annulatum]